MTIEVGDGGAVSPDEQRRTLILALDLLTAYLEPSTPGELLERPLPPDEMVNAIVETSPLTRVQREVYAEIDPPVETEDIEWLKRQQRFFLITLGLCTLWRITENPELLGDPHGRFSNKAELRAKLDAIRAHIHA